MSRSPTPRHVSPAPPMTRMSKSDGHHGGGLTPPPGSKRDRQEKTTLIITECSDYESSSPLSPPHSPSLMHRGSNPRKQSEVLTRRLKGKTGLRLQDTALRQYTEYDARGLPLSPFFSPGLWTGNTFGEPDIQTTLDRFEEDIDTLPVVDVFATKIVKAVLENTAAMARFRSFAEARGRVNDVDFLLQIGEYNQAISLVGSLVWATSLKFTGVAASSPVRLPLSVGKSLNSEIREASGTILPSLESLFDDTKACIEQSLAQDIYPDFLKQQLSLNLETIGPGYSPNQVCPGFGDAFCMTDPNEDDDPMVFITDGLAAVTGFRIEELISRNCRMFQGAGTRGSCVDRMRDSLSKRDEFTELVLNYTKDGRVYWNLLFVARLVSLEGELRYHLGGTIDVTEMLERQEDITHFLGFVPSSMTEAPPVQKPMEQPDRRTSWGIGQGRDRPQDREREERPRHPPSASRNKFLKSFRRRNSQPVSLSTESSSTSEPSTPHDPRRSMVFPLPSPSSPPSPHQVVMSPYSRFMVLEYLDPAGLPGLREKKSRAQMPLTFSSSATMDALGIGGQDYADVHGMDIFQVLSERAGSSSINKAFKSTVRASLSEGRAVKLDVSLGGSRPSRPRGLSSPKPTRNHSSSLGLRSDSSISESRSLRKSLSLEKLVPIRNGSGSATDFVSYWTPLKNDTGTTQWVVVILVPEVA